MAERRLCKAEVIGSTPIRSISIRSEAFGTPNELSAEVLLIGGLAQEKILASIHSSIHARRAFASTHETANSIRSIALPSETLRAPSDSTACNSASVNPPSGPMRNDAGDEMRPAEEINSPPGCAMNTCNPREIASRAANSGAHEAAICGNQD